MPDKKRNHIIPKCLIKQWGSHNGKYSGVHVYDVQKKIFNFSSGIGNAFSFAVENDFYITKLNSKRLSQIENFFSDIENTLALIIHRIKNCMHEDFFKNRLTFDKFLHAVLSLKFRTKGYLKNVRKQIADGTLSKSLLDKHGKTIDDILILETMMNSLNEEYLSYEHADVMVFYNKEGNLILGDEPFIGGDYVEKDDKYFPAFEFSFVILSPHYLLALTRATGKTKISFGDCPNKMAEGFNEVIAEQSEFWLVAQSQEKLLPFISKVNEEKFPIELRLRETSFLQSGFKIQDD